MEATKTLCQGCDTRRPKGQVFCIRTQQTYRICNSCRPAIVAGNIKESSEVLYKALRSAAEHGDHDQDCDRFSLEADPDDVCNCWFGLVLDTLKRVEGKDKD